MKRIITGVFSIGILFLFCVSARAYPGKVVKQFAAPGKFCSGMTFDGSALWLADYHADSLYRVDPATGSVLRRLPSPGFWPMGLAWDGKFLWNVDKKQNKIFKIDPANGKILQALDAPTGDSEGLTWDGTTLWISDVRKNRIMKLDMNDGTAVKRYDGPARSVNGLTFDGTYLWATDRLRDEIYMIDRNNGEVLMITDAPGKYTRGMAWDGTHLWAADYQNDQIYQLVRADDQAYRISDTRRARVTLTHEVRAYGPGKLNRLETYLAVPEMLPQQKILDIRFSPAEYKEVLDRWKQPLAVFTFSDQTTPARLQAQMIVETEISDIRYFIFPDRVGKLADIPGTIRETYTANGSKYLIDDPYIKAKAREIVGEESNPYWIARRIFDFVRNQLEYQLEGGWNVAPLVLQRGTGSCSEYTISFIALARAAGLPARYVGAIVVRGDDASFDEVFHRWPEVYLPNYGWIPFDPQGGDKPSPRDRMMNIGNLSNRFLITTQGGGDSQYLGWQYNYDQKYQCDPQVQVNVETFAEWEPLE